MHPLKVVEAAAASGVSRYCWEEVDVSRVVDGVLATYVWKVFLIDINTLFLDF